MGRPRKNPQPQQPEAQEFVPENLPEMESVPEDPIYNQAPEMVQAPVRPQPQAQPRRQQQELQTPQSNTLRRVEVLTNLANACKSREVLKALGNLPDGELILRIFVDAMQTKINQVMSGQEQAQVQESAETIRDNLDVVMSLADKLQTFFVQLHQSPLVSVLGSLNKNLEAKAAQPMMMQPPNPYQQPQQGQWQQPPSQPPQGQQVSPYYESQIEQTPQHTQKARTSNNGPAPTAPPRGGGINSW